MEGDLLLFLRLTSYFTSFFLVHYVNFPYYFSRVSPVLGFIFYAFSCVHIFRVSPVCFYVVRSIKFFCYFSFPQYFSVSIYIYLVHLFFLPPLWGVRPRIPTTDYMGCAPRGGPAHKTKPWGARRCSACPARHQKDILKILRDLLGYVRSHDSCNLLLLSGYLLNLTDL